MRKSIIIVGADMGSCVYTHNKNKDILILGERLTQGLDSYIKSRSKMSY